MYTTVNKAIVAFIAAGVAVAQALGWDITISNAVVTAVSAAIAGGLVWLIPNKQK